MTAPIRSMSIAGIVGGICTIASTFVYAFTHGTTSVNKMESLLGMNELEWGRIAAVIPLLLLSGLIAFRLFAGTRMNRLAQFGFWVASAALTIRVASEIPQFFINMREEYQSFLGIGSWLLYLMSLPLLIIGMLLLGIGCIRSGMGRKVSYAPLLLAFLIPLSFVGEGIFLGISDDSTQFRLSAGLMSIPLGLTWSWLSLVSFKKYQTPFSG